MHIQLFHDHYSEDHLDQVKAEMVKRGTPKIRVVYDDYNDLYIATEGCHRIRAAKDLGMIPEIEEVSIEKAWKINMSESGDDRDLKDFENMFYGKETKIIKF